MATAASLFVAFKTDQAQIANDLKRVRSSYESTFKGIKQLAGAYLTFEGVKGFGRLIAEHMEAIDAAKDLAASFGVTTQALGAMQLAAKESGVNDITAALGIMQRNLYAAAGGAKEQEKALRLMGLSLKELMGLSADLQFEKLAEGINKIEDPTIRAGAAAKIFGKGARELIPLLDDYKNKAADAAAFNEKFALSINAIDSAKVDEANDAMGRVKAAMGGVFNIIAVEVSPAVRQLSVDFLESMGGAEEFSVATVNSLEGVAWALDRVNVLIQSMGSAFIKTRDLIAGGLAANFAFFSGEGDLIKDIRKQTLENLEGEQSRFDNYDFNKIQKWLADARATSTARATEAAAKMAKLNGASIEALMEDLDIISDKNDKVGKSAAKAAKEAAKALTDMNKEAEESYKKLADSISGVFDGLLSELFGKSKFLSPVAGELANLFSPMLGGIFTNMFGGARAAGGPVSGSSAYLVGEKGPEMFFPGQSGYVAPNSAMGGGGINVIINNNAGANVSAQQQRNASGGTDIVVVVDQAVARLLSDPTSRSSRALRSTTGLSPMTASRG